MFQRWTPSDPQPWSTAAWWCVTAVAVLAAVGCADSPSTPATVDRNSEIRLGVAAGGSDSPDVGLAEAWRGFAYEGLTLRGGDGRPQPRLARSWSVSDDGLRWTFELAPGVVWHDGTPFSSTSAVEALNQVLSSQQRSAMSPGLTDITSVAAAGENTVVLTLAKPSAFLVDDLDLRLQKPGSPAPIGTGPFIPVSVTPTRVALRAHTRYHGGPPEVASFVVTQHPTTRQAWAELLRGELDAVWNVSADGAELLNTQAIETRSFPRRYVYLLAFNSGRPELRNPVVRRALNSAIDREALIARVLRGQGKPAWSPVWPEHWAYDQGASAIAFDPTLARAALASAGFSSRRLRFSCLVPEGFDVVERLALEMQHALHTVGVDLTFESVTLAELESRMAKGQFDSVLLDLLSGPSLSRLYAFWHSRGEGASLNFFGYADARVDAALDAVRRNGGESVVRASTGQLQRAFANNPPGIFIAWSERSRAVSRRIEVPTATGLGPFQPFAKWRVRRPDEVKAGTR